MKTFETFFMLVWLGLGVFMQDQAQLGGWNGIRPLHSTRQDVERLLGRSNEACRCNYEMGDLKVFVQYSDEKCSPFSKDGWDVPLDTVINVSVYPKTRPRLSELKIDLSKYRKTEDQELPGVFYYTNEESGSMIAAEGEAVSGFFYGPAKRDASLRCLTRCK